MQDFVLEPLFLLELKEATQPGALKHAANEQISIFYQKVQFGHIFCFMNNKFKFAVWAMNDLPQRHLCYPLRPLASSWSIRKTSVLKI